MKKTIIKFIIHFSILFTAVGLLTIDSRFGVIGSLIVGIYAGHGAISYSVTKR